MTDLLNTEPHFSTTREVWATQMRNAALNTLNDRLTDYRLSYLNPGVDFTAADQLSASLFALRTAEAELVAIEDRMGHEHTGDLRADRDVDTVHDRDHVHGVPDRGGLDGQRDEGLPVSDTAEDFVGPRGREAILTWLPHPLFTIPDAEPEPEPEPPACA